MKKFFTSLFLVLGVYAVFAQGIINNGSAIVINGGTYVNVSNGGYLNLTNVSDGSVNLDGVLKITGDFTNNATTGNVFTSVDTDGEVIFAGTGTQNITGTGPYINFEKVTVNSGSLTQIPANKAATINGALLVEGTFTSKTPLNDGAAGSLILNTTIGGGGDVNLERYFKVGNRWMYISVPISGQTSTPLIDDPYPGYVNPNFYTYLENYAGTDPATTDYSNWNSFTGMWNRIGTGTTLNVGTGYFWNAYQAPDVNITFTTSTPADVHAGDIAVNVTYTDNDEAGGNGEYYDGWNVVGNPFTSALDWELLAKTASMDNTVYFWDGDNANYIYYFHSADDHLEGATQIINQTGVTKYIPAYQSFVVHLTPAAGINDDNSVTTESFTLSKSAQVHSNQVMYKNEEKEDFDFDYIRLRTENNGYYDETLIRFIEQTSTDFCGKEDAFKMFPYNPQLPMIYSVTTNENEYPLSINTQPVLSEGKSIPLGFKTDAAGNFTISATELQISSEYDVFLIDTELNIENDLRAQSSYNFNIEAGENRERFYLFIAPTNPSNILDGQTYTASIYAQEKNVIINISAARISKGNVEIYNMLGEMVSNEQIAGPYTVIPVNASAGYYFVKLQDERGRVFTEKVYLAN